MNEIIRGENIYITRLKSWDEHMYIERRKNQSKNDGCNTSDLMTRVYNESIMLSKTDIEYNLSN